MKMLRSFVLSLRMCVYALGYPPPVYPYRSDCPTVSLMTCHARGYDDSSYNHQCYTPSNFGTVSLGGHSQAPKTKVLFLRNIPSCFCTQSLKLFTRPHPMVSCTRCTRWLITHPAASTTTKIWSTIAPLTKPTSTPTALGLDTDKIANRQKMFRRTRK